MLTNYEYLNIHKSVCNFWKAFKKGPKIQNNDRTSSDDTLLLVAGVDGRYL